MNDNSVLCRYIAAHPDWEDGLTDQYKVKVKHKGSYAIFNYSSDSDFADPLVQEARGIILDVEKLEVMCWPFRKFGNFNESYVDTIDWHTARVQEKIDGSIIKLWYDTKNTTWKFSTNAMISASEARAGETMALTFQDVIQSAENYGKLDFEKLNKDYTYIFELVSPQLQIVIHYAQPLLVHIGTRNRLTGQELEEDIGIIKPKSYPLHSLNDCILAAKQLNTAVPKGKVVEKEGFVVVDAQWHRVKIKSPDYLVTHRIVENCTWTKKSVLELLWLQKQDITYLSKLCPGAARIFLYYAYQLEELAWRCDRMAEYTRAVNKEVEGNRRAVAKVIATLPLAAVGFWSLGNAKPGRKWMKEQPLMSLMKHIQEYVPTGIE